jgi:pimeloyl-ACP methyl ester carboxylesterase
MRSAMGRRSCFFTARRTGRSYGEKWSGGSPDFQVHVFDWPGFGRSDRFAGQNITWDEQPRRLPELFDYWGLESPTVVAFDFAPIFALRAHFFAGLDIGAFVFADAAVSRRSSRTSHAWRAKTWGRCANCRRTSPRA